MKNKKYLVTGGFGFIGAAVATRLLENGHRVRILDNASRGTHASFFQKKKNCEIIRADIRDVRAVINAAKGIDAVFHLAYINGTEFFYTKPDQILDVGVRGVLNVIEACLKHSVRELFLASSSEVYQVPPVYPTPEKVPLIIPDPLNPRYSYGGGKIISEMLAIHVAKKHMDRVIIFRPHNVYGPQMGWEHVIPQFVLRLKKIAQKAKQEIVDFPIQGSGREVRSFIFIDDFVDGLMLIMKKGEPLGIYNIGVNRETTIAELGYLIARFFKLKPNIIPGQLLQGSPSRRCPDVSKLKALGFHEKYSLEQGLEKTVPWYINNKPLHNMTKVKPLWS